MKYSQKVYKIGIVTLATYKRQIYLLMFYFKLYSWFPNRQKKIRIFFNFDIAQKVRIHATLIGHKIIICDTLIACEIIIRDTSESLTRKISFYLKNYTFNIV